ncbi:MAG: glycosyl transferase, partial [Pedobacter sp.]|nr:glycosyl transferase [Pedobacter sp.]
YKNKAIIVLGVFIWFFNVSILLNLLTGLFLITYLKIALLQLVLKIVVELIFLIDVTGFAKRKELLILLPILNIFHVLYIIYIGIAGNSGKYNWKGRMVN